MWKNTNFYSIHHHVKIKIEPKNKTCRNFSLYCLLFIPKDQHLKKSNQGPTYLPVKFKMAHEHD